MDQRDRTTQRAAHSALFVTTVPITLEQFLAPFARHFRSRGWKVDALANGAAGDEHLEGSFDERFDVAWSRNPLAPNNLIGTAGSVRSLVERGHYDIVHVHTPIAAFVTRYALRSLPDERRPVIIYTAHGFHFYAGGSPFGNLLFRTMERTAARWTDYLVAINAEDFEAAQAFRTIDRSNVRLIPGIGVDTDHYRPDAVDKAHAEKIRAELGVPADAFMLTMLAEFAPVKRHEHVLAALAKCNCRDVVLALIGGGPLEERIRSSIDRLGLTDRVRITGWRRDIPAVLVASDALILASEREGLPRSVMEGMSSGLPVVGTETRGITDAVGSEAGWIVAKHDVDALAAAIDRAASDPAECARRGTLARKRAVELFSLDRIIHSYEELYREALASRV